MDKADTIERDEAEDLKIFIKVMLAEFPNMTDEQLSTINLQAGYLLQDRREKSEWQDKYEN